MSAALGRRNFLKFALAALTFVGIASSVPRADDNFIIVQSTTSTQNSGLFEYLLPLFTKKTGIEVRVGAVGTGQALKNAENGDGDVVFALCVPRTSSALIRRWRAARPT